MFCKNENSEKLNQNLVAVGLLISSLGNALNFGLPQDMPYREAFRGLFVGFGLGLLLTGAVRMLRRRNATLKKVGGVK